MVIGASTNPARYSYLVANKLVRKGYEIVNIGRKTGIVAGVSIEGTDQVYSDIDTVTLYVSPKNQSNYLEYILKTKPRRVIFNPGTENPGFANALEEQGVEVLEACTLVMLNTGQY